jgi:hypothetical protein
MAPKDNTTIRFGPNRTFVIETATFTIKCSYWMECMAGLRNIWHVDIENMTASSTELLPFLQASQIVVEGLKRAHARWDEVQVQDRRAAPKNPLNGAC